MDYNQNRTAIKFWAEEDRPREKLLLKGRHTLSNAELLAILISTGTKSKSAIDLAREILAACNNDLNELAKQGIKDLTKIDGIGEAKAITIISAIELGGRRQASEVRQRKTILNSRDTFEILQPRIGILKHEEFWILLLNRANKLIGEKMVSEGGTDATIADPKKIFKMVMEEGASSIVLAHNHPSGNTRPSTRDIELTRKLAEGGRLLDITVLDHVIVTESGYYSFADEGMM